METGLAGRKAIIRASSRGLGRACAKALAAEGGDVVINGRTEETVASAASEIRSAFPKVTLGGCLRCGYPRGTGSPASSVSQPRHSGQQRRWPTAR